MAPLMLLDGLTLRPPNALSIKDASAAIDTSIGGKALAASATTKGLPPSSLSCARLLIDDPTISFPATLSPSAPLR